MIVLLSPAKTLDYETPLPFEDHTQPAYLKQSGELVDLLKQATPEDLSELMGISHELAVLNVNRFQAWTRPFNLDNAKQAIYAFKGDVYEGLDAYTLDLEDLQFAQRHLRILSGLYGILRPLDLMRPYRLEMGTRLKNAVGSNLYQFWGATQTDHLNKTLAELRLISPDEENTIVNLASNEYFKSVKPAKLNARVVTPSFLDRKGASYKMISFYAKRARGLMARFIIQRQLREPAELEQFDLEGYRFDPTRSQLDAPVFIRDPA
ncbi:MAG: peroxide stress protein YaaA [Hahellaceae bacterium]|jgi:cytoplasmic iron level regulating protein YaaA (DUF328/UPF0246 family)|nr:peroxide stress protein YaaA [Hahellaceae bacterium]